MNLSYHLHLCHESSKLQGISQVVALNVSKVMDKVWRATRLNKFFLMVYHPNFTSFKSFLADLIINVAVDSYNCNFQSTNAHIVQYSVLPHTSFVLHISEKE